ncbi:hypothetical protein QQS21_009347 [Conoideocrella luteorostrata]|uniref:Uncharacterized protein n=1 Tax=Conoideocrella luteorostrata TaxID=1105319 RepID=A0AAJ0CH26_9HYPO|nr:hypothetical protein QQS21_009347 [Conoideocrella luteorostrata]
MPSSQPAQPPLPLAPNRTAIANQISLLLSQRSSLLKPLTAQSSVADHKTKRLRPEVGHDNNDDTEFFKESRPNDGVGYVPETTKTTTTRGGSREERMLRGRLWGRRKEGVAAGRASRLAESESDDEEGRGSLGKSRNKSERKRKRRRVEEAEEIDTENEEGTRIEEEDAGKSSKDDGVIMNDAAAAADNTEVDTAVGMVPDPLLPEEISEQGDTEKMINKKRKRRNRKKNKGEGS